MKLVPIAIAAVLACGSALAQAPDAAQRAENREKAGNVAEKGVDGAKRAANATERGVKRAAKATGNVTRKAASKVRNVGDSIASKLPPAPGGRTAADNSSERTAMGAGPAAGTVADDRGDSSRRQRMDDAYGNWQRQGNR